jgi:hypothetical protein
MQWLPVHSSNVSRIAYESGTLLVQFHNGSTYQYDGVPFEVWEEFMSASSKGQFVWQRLRGKYPYHRIG